MKAKISLMCLALPAAVSLSYAAPAAENWENSCASCHGAEGKGDTKKGKKLKLRDYSNPKVQVELKDEEMLKAIIEGVTDKGKERMKAFKDEMSEAEAKELVAYVRKLKA